MKRPSRLALRIYLIGLAQIAALVFVIWFARPKPPGFPGSRSPDGSVVIHAPPPLGRAPPAGWAAVPIAIVLVLVGISAALTAAWLARPLQRLSEAARSLGVGRLSARAEFRRADELGDLALAFDEMAERIQALVRGQRELLANVSHELRTPLARIRVALDLAAETGDASGGESLQGIAGDLAEMERLIDDILMSARLEVSQDQARGLPPLRLEPLPVVQLFEDAAARFHARHPKRALELELTRLPGELRADRMLLRRALDNLLDNAARYSTAEQCGSPEQPLSLSARAEGALVLMAVRDCGRGIDAEDLPHLFTPFFRADKSRTRATGGLGLGLLLARRIVEAHQGAIRVESKPGQGTTVFVSLPLHEV